MARFRMRNIKALFILNIEKMNFFKIRSKCITFVGIDHILGLDIMLALKR